MELTNLENKILEMQLKEYRKFLRLSSERDIYNLNQAAFRLNISRNRIESEFIKTGLIKQVRIRGEYRIPKSEIDNMIESSDRFVHKDSIK
jgi:hypothetical protein